MKIVIIGAAGRTSSASVQEARRRGHDVIAVARRPVFQRSCAAGILDRVV